jgi:hypothetical protein
MGIAARFPLSGERTVMETTRLNLKAAWALALLSMASLPGARADGQHGAHTGCETETAKELLKLRADLTDFLIEQQEIRIAGTIRDVEAVRMQLSQLTQEEREHAQDVLQLEQQLTAVDLEPEARPQMQSLKIQLATDGVQTLRTKRAALIQSDAQLAEKLKRETGHRQHLLERARQLQLAISTR